MCVLLDECLPRRLKRELPDHEVRTAPEMGWAGVENGELLRLASGEFDVFITVDRSLEFQQNLSDLALGRPHFSPDGAPAPWPFRRHAQNSQT